MFKKDTQLDDFFGIQPDLKEPKEPESIKESLVKKLTSKAKLRLIPKILSVRERYAIFALLLIMAVSFLAIPVSSYYHFTEAQPDYGGSFSEGILGEPRLINPLLSQNNDVDRDLTSIMYSGLLKYNEEGKLIPDLAKSYEISTDGLSYTIFLKENALWHDGKPVTVDDIMFTIQLAQNPDYASLQRINWQGVEMEKVNDFTLVFKLKNKYAQFLNNLTLGILPEHIWQEVKPLNFNLSEFNLKPIGSGPYVFKKLLKDKSGRIATYELEAFENYYNGKPYIKSFEVKFYNSEDELIDAYNKNEVENIGFVSARNIEKLKFQKRITFNKIKLPRYFALFYNQNESRILADKNIRTALNYGTDKNSLIAKILNGNGLAVHSPMITDMFDISDSVQKYEFDVEQAKKLLIDAGWAEQDENGVRSKKTTVKPADKKKKVEEQIEHLSVKITTSTWPELQEVATILREQFQAIGVKVTIETLPISQLQQSIKDRTYEILLFGEILTLDPDPFTLWHSSQKRDPGLNLALYDNKTADTLLEEARQTLNPAERMKKYDDFQKLVTDDAAANFLYSPLYIYGQSRKIQGFKTHIISMPSDRFADISQWYINTKESGNNEEYNS